MHFASSISISDAIDLQRDMATHVRIENDFDNCNLIAGIDVSYDVANNQNCAAIVLMELDTFKTIQTLVAHDEVDFPYVPGLLSFREIPVIQKAYEHLKQKPDVLMVDGHGIAHPRRLGIAAHLGVLLDMPAFGVAKSRLIGNCMEPGPLKGDQSMLMHKKEQIGIVLRSKDKTRALFVSAGHRIDHETAVDLTVKCLTKYRLPEPTRQADKLSRQHKVLRLAS